ncbi:MAG: site-2 protease family protein [Desulfuromonadaceae bacterium]|nr:site-2 protease family protein [Desulfuromonadaceae bacterium]
MEHLLVKISIMLVPALLAVTVHEVAHGYVADRFGDPTARLLNRLTLNPLRHLDIFGTLALLLVGFGWAKPVPVNQANLRNPHRHMLWVAVSGPVSNFILAGLSAFLVHFIGMLHTLGVESITEPLMMMAAFSLYINVILGVINMVPIPPLDGGRVLAALLPARYAAVLMRLEPFGFFIVIGLIFFTQVWSAVVGPVVYAIVDLLAGAHVEAVFTVIQFLFSK